VAARKAAAVPVEAGQGPPFRFGDIMSDDQIEYLEKKRADLERSNNRSYNELRQKIGPSFEMDSSHMRRELFINCLVKWGIVSKEQALEFEIAFHETVEKSLDQCWAEIRESEKGRALTVVKNPEGLVDKHGRPLT
jgi:hypothetical protein